MQAPPVRWGHQSRITGRGSAHSDGCDRTPEFAGDIGIKRTPMIVGHNVATMRLFPTRRWVTS